MTLLCDVTVFYRNKMAKTEEVPGLSVSFDVAMLFSRIFKGSSMKMQE